jgi:hypothetical protein
VYQWICIGVREVIIAVYFFSNEGGMTTEKDKAKHANKVDELYQMFSRRESKTRTGAIGASRIVTKCLRWMASLYNVKQREEWKTSKAYKAAYGRVLIRQSDGVNLGATRFLRAMEEIMLTPESRYEAARHAGFLAARAAQGRASAECTKMELKIKALKDEGAPQDRILRKQTALKKYKGIFQTETRNGTAEV